MKENMKHILPVYFKVIYWPWRKVQIRNSTFNSQIPVESIFYLKEWFFNKALLLLCPDSDESYPDQIIWKRPSTYQVRTSTEKILTLEGSMFLLFCGPHTGILYGQLERCDRGYRTPSTEISRQNLAQGSKKDFIASTNQVFSRYNLTR